MLNRTIGFLREEPRLLIIAGLVALLRVPSLVEPLWYGDEAVYLTASQQILRGDALYVDIFDNKPPLLYYLTAGALAVFGHSVTAIKLLPLASSIATLFVLYYLARRLLDRTAALVGVALLALLITPTWLEGNVVGSEILMILPTCVGMLLGFQRRFFLAGCAFGIAFLFKVPAIFDFAAFFVFVALSVERERERMTLSHLSVLSVGFLIPFLVSVFLFVALGGLDEYFKAAFLSGVDFTSSDETGSGEFLFSHGRLLLNALPILLLVTVLAARSLADWRSGKRATPSAFEFMLLWLAFSFYGVLLAGRPHEHYLIQAAPPFALLLAFALTQVDFRRYLAAGALLLVLAIALDQGFELAKLNPDVHGRERPNTLAYYIDYNENFLDYALGDKDFDAYADFFDGHISGNYRIASLLRQESEEGDSLYVYSDQTALYFGSHLKPAAKYVAFYHLEWDEARKPPTAEEVTASRPLYIVAEEPRIGEFTEIDTLIAQHYELVGSEGTFRVYKRTTGLPSTIGRGPAPRP
jgi:hypothetical protein